MAVWMDAVQVYFQFVNSEDNIIVYCNCASEIVLATEILLHHVVNKQQIMAKCIGNIYIYTVNMIFLSSILIFMLNMPSFTGLWDTMNTIVSDGISLIVSRINSSLRGSTLERGSSNNSRSGFLIIARAIAMRCF